MASSWKRFMHRLFQYLTAFAQWLSRGFFWILYLGQAKTVPKIENSILLKSATTLAAEIRERKIKCEDVVKAYIQRIQEVEPFIHAVADERFGDAIIEARNVDAFLASRDKSAEDIAKEKPLLGVPITIKVLIGVKGMRCTAGSLIFKDLRAHEDGEAVALFRNAGAICLATSNSAEFGLNYETNNHLYGRTSNPHNITRTSGGSSGGEGALISSGASILGLGNDLGGSIRLPCFYNGIFGHKPTRGIVPNKGLFPTLEPTTNEYLCTGPMCRYTVDLVTSMRILASSSTSNMKFGVPVDFRNIKIYYMYQETKHPDPPKVHKDIIDAQKKVISHLEETYGIKAKEVNIRNLKYSFRIWVHKIRSSTTKSLVQSMTAGKLELSPTMECIKLLLRTSKLTIGPVLVMNVDKLPFVYDVNKLDHVDSLLKDLENEFESILDENSLFLYPTFPCTAPYHNESNLMTLAVGYMAVFNILGYPVTQCPIGKDKDGLPLGIQIVGKTGNDHLTIALASELEKAFGGWIQPNTA